MVLNAALEHAALVQKTPQDAVEAMIATKLTAVVDLARLALPHLLTAAAERGAPSPTAIDSDHHRTARTAMWPS